MVIYSSLPPSLTSLHSTPLLNSLRSSQLLQLLRQSLLWQVHTNTLPKALETKITREGEEEQPDEMGTYNIATGEVTNLSISDSNSTNNSNNSGSSNSNSKGCVKELKGVVKLSKYSNPLSFTYIASPPCVVTGGDDGLIELWDADTCKLFQNAYQSTERFMSHSEGVTALANSPDYEMLASADTAGTIKVWSVSSGQCVRKFEGGESTLCRRQKTDVGERERESIGIDAAIIATQLYSFIRTILSLRS